MIAQKIIAAALEIECVTVPADASMDNFTPWDSLGHMKIILQLEAEIGRTMTTEEILSVTNISSVQTLIDTD